MIRVVNTFFAVLLAAAVTFSLFFLMQLLIASSDELPEKEDRPRIADITIPDQEPNVQRVSPKPQKIEEIEELPDLPEPDFNPTAPQGEGLAISRVEVDLGNMDSGASLSSSDAEYLPIVTVPPQYPQRAQQRGIEGWCLVEFTVNENGGVENAVVKDGDPPGIFDSSSLRAVARFKFNPRTENGEPVKTHGVQYVFTYRLAD